MAVSACKSMSIFYPAAAAPPNTHVVLSSVVQQKVPGRLHLHTKVLQGLSFIVPFLLPKVTKYPENIKVVDSSPEVRTYRRYRAR